MCCGECTKAMCSDFMIKTCDHCKEVEEAGEDLCGVVECSTICAMCMVWCKECTKEYRKDESSELFTCHKSCLAEHHKRCNNKSRKERKLTSLNESIKIDKEKLFKKKYN
jgi:hypothetical protein